MSIEFEAKVFFGAEFENMDAAQEWYLDNVGARLEEVEYMCDYGFNEFIDTYTPYCGVILNSFSGEGFFLGFDMTPFVSDPTAYLAEYNRVSGLLLNLFRDKPFGIKVKYIVS